MASWISLTPTGKNVYNAISGVVQKGEDWIKKNILDSGVGSKLVSSAVKAANPFSIIDDAKTVYNSAMSANDYSGSYVSGKGSGSGSGSGGSVAAAAGSPAAVSSDPYKSYIDMVNEITDRNNAWAAAQAEKQMQFQREMSDTAHQREVADLKAAGLNPVLSAGAGGGAATPSGAMATPDTTNSRIIGEIALNAVEGLSNSATGLSYGMNRSSSAKTQLSKNLENLVWKTVLPTVVRKML